MADPKLSTLDRRSTVDLRWLMGILTLAATIMYVVLLATTPSLRHLLPLAAMTVLMVAHLALHWSLIRIAPNSAWLNAYMLLQGILFLGIALISASPYLIFTLFADLLGEAVSTLGLTRRGILASLYFILLLMTGLFVAFDLAITGWMIVGTAAIVVSTVLYTVLYKRQVEARRRAQLLLQELEEANLKLSDYAARVEELTAASERQRMARDLHDTLSQGLVGLILQLEAVEAHLKGKRLERALAIVQEMKKKARETLADSRQAITDLRREGGVDLEETIRKEADHFTSSTGIPCDVEIGLPEALPQALCETVHRLIAEGLTNIGRHARASRADLHIANINGKYLLIEMADNGIGFEPEAVQTGHFGLLGIGERARLAGGEFDIHSRPGEGTQLVIRLPLDHLADPGKSKEPGLERES
jgi:NarL family two-component system sensor histidine kinase YdfH